MQKPDPEAVRDPLAKGRTPAKILVVDDDEANRRLLHEMLAADGYANVEAADGEAALAAAARERPDLVLLDVMMPGIDGFEVARRLKATAATRSIPIILVTALNDRESRLRGWRTATFSPTTTAPSTRR